MGVAKQEEEQRTTVGGEYMNKGCYGKLENRMMFLFGVVKEWNVLTFLLDLLVTAKSSNMRLIQWIFFQTNT